MAAVNTYIKPKEEKKEKKKPTGFLGRVSSYKVRMKDDLAIKYLPYLLYMTLLGIIYIANNHNAEKLAGEITKLEREVKVKQMEYSTLKYEFMNASRKAEIAQKLRSMDLYPNDRPVIRIGDSSGD